MIIYLNDGIIVDKDNALAAGSGAAGKIITSFFKYFWKLML